MSPDGIDTNTSEIKVAGLPKFKLVFVGDQSVGKTSIINRFIFDTFDGKDQPTVGIDFISKTLYIDNTQVRLQLWDTAGQERFRSLIPSYIRDSTIVIIVYDITNETSFHNVTKWYQEVRNIRGEDALIAIIGNKIDKEEARQVQLKDGEDKSKELGCIFMEVSAKTGDGISQMFQKIISCLPGVDASQVISSQAPATTANVKLSQNGPNTTGSNNTTKGGDNTRNPTPCC